MDCGGYDAFSHHLVVRHVEHVVDNNVTGHEVTGQDAVVPVFVEMFIHKDHNFRSHWIRLNTE